MVCAKLSPSPNSSLPTPKNPSAPYFILKFVVHLRPPLCHSASLSAFLLLLCSFHPIFASRTCSAGWLQHVPPTPSHHHLPLDFNERIINCKAFEKPGWGKTQDDAGSLSIPFTCSSPLFYKIALSFGNTHISIQKHILTWIFFQHCAVLW